MDERLIEGILERPDATAIVAELRARLEARSYERMPIAARLAAAEKLVAKAARSMEKAARMFPGDPLNPRFEESRARLRVLLKEVKARKAEARSQPIAACRRAPSAGL